MSKEAMKLALEALNTTESDCGSRAWEREQEAITALLEALTDSTTTENNGGKTGWPPGLLQDDCKGLSKWLSSRPDARRRVRDALEEQPAQGCNYCNHALYSGTKCKNCGRVTEQAAIKRDLTPEQPAQQDIPDLIAGTLGVSRGTAYDLMREALAQERSSDEQPAPVQEPVGQNICIECANADSWGLPDKPACRSCVSNSEWKPLNVSSKNPINPPVQEPTVENNSQEWAGMDGATAWHLIHRHADGWADVWKMMDEWREANTTPPAAQRQWVGLTTDDVWGSNEVMALNAEMGLTIVQIMTLMAWANAKLKEKNT